MNLILVNRICMNSIICVSENLNTEWLIALMDWTFYDLFALE